MYVWVGDCGYMYVQACEGTTGQLQVSFLKLHPLWDLIYNLDLVDSITLASHPTPDLPVSAHIATSRYHMGAGPQPEPSSPAPSASTRQSSLETSVFIRKKEIPLTEEPSLCI